MSAADIAAGRLVSVVYVSSAEREFAVDELRAMLSDLRHKNARHGITGMLLYRDGNFLQVIEGSAAAVDQLLVTLKQDRRHKGMIVIRRLAIAERDFGEWQMAFRDISGNSLSELEGYSTFMDASFQSAEFQAEPRLVHKLLMGFKQQIL